MDSSQFRNSSNVNHDSESATSSGTASQVRRVALVVALAGFAFFALATRNSSDSGQLPAPPGAMNQAENQLAPTSSDYYFPAQFVNQAKTNDGNVMTYEHD